MWGCCYDFTVENILVTALRIIFCSQILLFLVCTSILVLSSCRSYTQPPFWVIGKCFSTQGELYKMLYFCLFTYISSLLLEDLKSRSSLILEPEYLMRSCQEQTHSQVFLSFHMLHAPQSCFLHWTSCCQFFYPKRFRSSSCKVNGGMQVFSINRNAKPLLLQVCSAPDYPQSTCWVQMWTSCTSSRQEQPSI